MTSMKIKAVSQMYLMQYYYKKGRYKYKDDEYLSQLKRGQKFVPIITVYCILEGNSYGMEPEACMSCWK